MKICLLTDLHIDLEGKYPLNIDTRQHFQIVLAKAQETKYDFLILAGDLCNQTGDDTIYAWIKEQLKDITIPIKVIAGNHDHATLLANAFGEEKNLHDNELYYTYRLNAIKFIFLDTSKGEMSENQWHWLNEKIKVSGKDVFIFMHHPPLAAGALHMEPRYSFRQMDRFAQLCNGYPDQQFHIFTGHYHLERTIHHKNRTVYITPSTFVQINPDYEAFQPITDQIGYREITLLRDGFHTNIVYV